MLRKNSSVADSALFDAIAAFFSNMRPSSSAFASGQSAQITGLSTAKRESSERLANASRFVVSILGVLTLVTALVIAYDIRAISEHFVDHQVMGWNSPGMRLSFVVFVLLLI